MKKSGVGSILIECPNTIFQLFINNEEEISKIEIFMGNIRAVKHLGINDIYNWCNRQGIEYNTHFNYHKELSAWKTIKSYLHYQRQKMKYQIGLSFV